MARCNDLVGGFYSDCGEQKKSHIGRNSLVFIIAFMTYHIGYGCRIGAFPVAPETNKLIVPIWYPFLGIAISSAVTAAWAHRKEIAGRIGAALRWIARKIGAKLYETMLSKRKNVAATETGKAVSAPKKILYHIENEIFETLEWYLVAPLDSILEEIQQIERELSCIEQAHARTEKEKQETTTDLHTSESCDTTSVDVEGTTADFCLFDFEAIPLSGINRTAETCRKTKPEEQEYLARLKRELARQQREAEKEERERQKKADEKVLELMALAAVEEQKWRGMRVEEEFERRQEESKQTYLQDLRRVFGDDWLDNEPSPSGDDCKTLDLGDQTDGDAEALDGC